MPFYLQMSKNITQQRDIQNTLVVVYIYINMGFSLTDNYCLFVLENHLFSFFCYRTT